VKAPQVAPSRGVDLDRRQRPCRAAHCRAICIVNRTFASSGIGVPLIRMLMSRISLIFESFPTSTPILSTRPDKPPAVISGFGVPRAGSPTANNKYDVRS